MKALDPQVYELARCIREAAENIAPHNRRHYLVSDYLADTGRDLLDDVVELAELIGTEPTTPPAPPEGADCPGCQPSRNAALMRCRDCGKLFTPCDEHLVPGDPSIPCCLAKGHAGSHQDAPLPKRRWT